MYIFGTQYLRGETPSRDQWMRDLENIKKYGFNTVRAWVLWNTVEKSEGEFDHEYLSEFLNCVAQNDLQAGLLFHMHASPEWASKKYSKYFYVDNEGRHFDPAHRANTPSGGWPGLCFDHSEVRELEERFISGVISETKKHDCVSFYEPMNEPHQWIDYAKWPAGIFCYCDATVKKFKKWLRAKYGDIAELNLAWGRNHNDFDEVRIPTWMAGYADYIDFRLFTIDNVVEEIAYRSDIIRKNDTKPVIAHSWGGGCTTCAQLGGMAFDDWKNAEVFDKWGFSAFPNTAEDCVSLALGSVSTRNAAGGKEFWQSELSAGLRGTGLHVRGRVDDNTFDKFSFESIRHGAKGLLYWQYRKERYGSEFAGFSMTDFDGGPTNLVERASKICNMLQKNDKLWNSNKPLTPEVALIFSMRSYLANWAEQNRRENKFSVDSLSGYFRMFWEENIPTDVLHEDTVELSSLKQYKIVILPCSFAISPKTAEVLKQYVKEGGTLFSEPYFGVYDEYFRLSYSVPGFGFDKIFGCSELDLTQAENTVLTKGGKKFAINGGQMLETFKNVTGEAVYAYQDGSPAIIRGSYGSGKAYITGVNLGLAYSSRTLVSDDILSDDTANTSADAKEILLGLCKDLGVKQNCCNTPGVGISLLETDTDYMLAVMINYNAKAAVGEITVDDKTLKTVEEIYGKAEEKLCGNKINFAIKANETVVLKIKI